MTPPSHRAFLLTLSVVALIAAPSAHGQGHPFLYSFTPARDTVSRSVVYADLGYGKSQFGALGAQNLEPRAGLQLALGQRMTLAAQLGWAATDAAVSARASAGAELFAELSPRTSHALLALGVGAMRDYSGTGVALGRVVMGGRWTRTMVVGNVRLERPFASTSDSADEKRDAVDVITTLGFLHEVSPGVRLGVEAVAEDLEGFFENEEAEGGAKLMVGPSVGFTPRQAQWSFVVAGGPIVRLTQSSVQSGSGAPRDLTTHDGYVIRTSIAYRW